MSAKKHQSAIESNNAFMVKMEDLVKEIIIQNNVPYYRIESRMDQVLGKQNENIYVPVIRVITYFEDAVTQISEVMSREFDVTNERSLDKKKVRADNLSYKQVAYAASLKPARQELTEYKRLGATKFEIQICSMLQDAWSGIEKELGYDSATFPDEMKRDFYRVGALLEMADLEFLKIRSTLSTQSGLLNGGSPQAVAQPQAMPQVQAPAPPPQPKAPQPAPQAIPQPQFVPQLQQPVQEDFIPQQQIPQQQQYAGGYASNNIPQNTPQQGQQYYQQPVPAQPAQQQYYQQPQQAPAGNTPPQGYQQQPNNYIPQQPVPQQYVPQPSAPQQQPPQQPVPQQQHYSPLPNLVEQFLPQQPPANSIPNVPHMDVIDMNVNHPSSLAFNVNEVAQSNLQPLAAPQINDMVREQAAKAVPAPVPTPAPTLADESVALNIDKVDTFNMNVNGLIERRTEVVRNAKQDDEEDDSHIPFYERKEKAAKPAVFDENAQMTDETLRDYVAKGKLVREVDAEIARRSGATLNNEIDVEGDVERLKFMKVFSIKQLHERIQDNKNDIVAFAEKWIGSDNGGSFDSGICLFYLEYLLVGKRNDPAFAVEYVLKFISDNDYSARFIIPTYNSISKNQGVGSNLTLK